jgi:hypothetical protein
MILHNGVLGRGIALGTRPRTITGTAWQQALWLERSTAENGDSTTVVGASACGSSAAGGINIAFQSECQVREARLAASQGLRDHRRRVLEHQEKIDAGQRRQAAEPSDAQLTMPLIGEIRRPEAALPKRRRPRIKKAEPSQPELGES